MLPRNILANTVPITKNPSDAIEKNDAVLLHKLKRAGHNPLWALLAYFPLLGIIGLWVLALRAPRSEI